MSAFKIKSNLDIGGNQLLNYCVGTYNDLTSVNRNTGYKLFYVPVDLENKWYRRELIFDGEDWHAAAYLDDLTSFKDEDFNALKEKVDLLSGDVDTDAIISNMKEVSAFLEGFAEDASLMDLLNNKLDKTGGTITGKLTSNGRIIAKSFLQFNQFNADAEYLLGMTDNNGILRWYNGSSWNTLLHSGNYSDLIGDTYLKTDGSKIMTAPIKFSAGSVDYDAVGDGLAVLYTSSANNAPNNDEYGRTLSVVNGSAGFQLGIAPAYPTLYYRAKNSNSWSGWKTIAFTDSDITGNAATATKLKNKVSLWGNEFDGTQDLGGSISFKDGDKLRSVLDYVNNSEFHLGYGTRTLNLTIWGTPIYFYANSTRVMTITDGGNVLVGVASQTNTDFKFEVSGLSRIYTAGQSMSLGKVPTSGLVLGSSTGLQGQFYFDYSGNICLQGQSVSDSTTRALNLNPLGGAVNVGEGGLNVYGQVVIGTTNRANLYFSRNSVNYIWAPSEGGYFAIGVKDVGDTSPASASLVIGSTRVIPGERNNAVSLGTSSYRWSDVYSVNGNFSGRVLIGSNTDDENFKLNVAGAVKITRSNDVTTYLGITVNDILTTFDANDSSDNYMHYSFQSHGTELLRLNGKEGGTSYFRTLVGFDKKATFNAGALIPTGQKLTIGDATIEYDSIAKAIKVDGNLFTTGTNASGGVADAQQGGTGGNAEVHEYTLDSGTDFYKIINPKGSTNVIVQVYEWNGNGNSWDMILTDVSVNEANIFVTFVGNTSVKHLVTVV